ncbi:hypothetical protein [Burkholderia cenocepacia]|uniref:hypothetical protein n=1 Tax=Burkholderia cenocepacia TaxID=95486 RepID=UPI001F4A1FBA|nr:hypothetical protein [Burkholderia cenocepacia]
MADSENSLPAGYYTREMLDIKDLDRRTGGSVSSGIKEFFDPEKVANLADSIRAGVTPESLENLISPIERARSKLHVLNGEASLIQEYMEQFCYYVERGWTPPYEYLQAFARSFRLVMNGEPWEFAFPLEGRSIPNAIKGERLQLERAIAVAEELERVPGSLIKDAVSRAAVRLNTSEKSIRAGWDSDLARDLREDLETNAKK